MAVWKGTCALMLIALAGTACDLDPSSDTTAGLTSTTSSNANSDASASTVASSTAPTNGTTGRPDPVEGWGRLGTDTSVFGGVVPLDGAADGDRLVLVGCPSEDLAGFPIWWAAQGFDFVRASAPETSQPLDARCVQEIVSTRFGWFAGGAGPLLRSSDGITWEVVDVPSILGYEFAGQLGYVDNLFLSPDGERLTLLYRRAAEAESTVATLVTTTDGETWVKNAHPSQSLFDSSGIAAVVQGGDGLLAVGSSPGGEFVPTAAVFTSPDGLRWRRVTPRGDPDFDDKVMEDVMWLGDRFIGVGGDFFETGLMTAWSSPDGLAWRRLPHPPETTDPSVAQMTARAVTVADGFVWVAGQDFDARRTEPQSLPALWRSADGEAWERIPFDALGINVPFEIASTPDLRIGVWPPPNSPIDEPIVLYAAD